MRKGLLKSALLGAAALGAISLAGARVAHANPVQIGFATSNNGAAPTNFHTGTYYTTDHTSTGGQDYSYATTGNTYRKNSLRGKAVFDGSFGGITTTIDSVIGSPLNKPPQLGSTINTTFSSNAVSNTLYVYATETDINTPASSFNFGSVFAATSLSGISKIYESTYIDPKNNAFNTSGNAFQTGLKLFTGTGGGGTGGVGNGLPQVYSTPSTLTGPYSITEVYEIIVGSGSSPNAQASITTEAVPEPGSLALLGTGLLGLGLIGRRRRRKA